MFLVRPEERATLLRMIANVHIQELQLSSKLRIVSLDQSAARSNVTIKKMELGNKVPFCVPSSA